VVQLGGAGVEHGEAWAGELGHHALHQDGAARVPPDTRHRQ
jgi:hypothetical protein